MKFFELVLDEEKLLHGIDAISIVEHPAIEEDFITMSKDQKMEFKEIDQEKKILMGAAMIPDKPIYRREGEEEYYVFFTKETIRRASELYLMNGKQSNATLEHQEKISGLSLVESWIIEDPEKDKSRAYGLEYPVGTWMVSMKVNNQDIWEEYVKSGKVKGFSIEGWFMQRESVIELSSQLSEIESEEGEHLLELYLLGLIKGVVKNDKRYKSGKKLDMESYRDYPDSVSNNAKKGIELNEKGGNKCATQVGKIRAQQLAQKQPVSLETIKRMYSYLSRAQEYYDEGDKESCGYISYMLWGGLSGKRWAESKLKELDQFAEIGERGGVRPSKKAPKSGTPNKNPKGEGTAKGDAGNTRSAKVTKEQEATLQKKSDEFNERYKDKLGYGANIGALKAVFQRGLGAFNTSHSPKVKSAEQWAYARVNAFLYMIKNGRPENSKYTGDFDLLPTGHPKKPK